MTAKVMSDVTRQKNIIRAKKWYQKNKERKKKDVSMYRSIAENSVRLRAFISDWQKVNKVKRYASHKKWAQSEKGKRANSQRNHNRKAKVRGAVGKHTLQEWEALKAKHEYTCVSCHKKEPEIKLTRDHIVPISKGGSNYITNIQPLCGSCNSRKKDKL